MLLGVNIDHVATLRQARGTRYPSIVQAALTAEQGGADAITVHLREDRRHIQDRDIALLSEQINGRMNLEIAVTGEMLAIAERWKPSDVCLVPERRQELTTEGGLNVAGNPGPVQVAVQRLSEAGIRVSLFVDPDAAQLDAAQSVGAPVVELHTGAYADAAGAERQLELERIIGAVDHGVGLGLQINAGHGLHYYNVQAIAAMDHIVELNIGHAIVARAVFCGLYEAVRDMKALLVDGAR